MSCLFLNIGVSDFFFFVRISLTTEYVAGIFDTDERSMAMHRKMVRIICIGIVIFTISK